MCSEHFSIAHIALGLRSSFWEFLAGNCEDNDPQNQFYINLGNHTDRCSFITYKIRFETQNNHTRICSGTNPRLANRTCSSCKSLLRWDCLKYNLCRALWHRDIISEERPISTVLLFLDTHRKLLQSRIIKPSFSKNSPKFSS